MTPTQKTSLKLAFAVLAAVQSIGLTAAAQMGSSKVSRRGRYEVKQLVTPGFEALPLKRKLFAYALAKAFSSAEDIAWLQMSRDGLEIRYLMEKIWEKEAKLSPQELASISAYYFEILLHNGIYDTYSNEKYTVKGLSEGDFRNLLKKLQIELPANFDSLVRVMFDPSVKRHFKAPEGQDLLLASGSNFYGDGLSEAEVQKLGQDFTNHSHNYPIRQSPSVDGKNVQVLLLNTREQYASHLTKLVRLLERAKSFAEPKEAELISAYQKALRSGNPRDFIEADRLWLRLKPKDLDFSFGFIETYDDPMGRIGTFQASIVLLSNTDPEEARRAKALRASTGRYEQLMPVDARFKQTGESNPPQAEGAYLLFWVGGGHAGGPRGFNLPNNAELRSEEGSRSYTLLNKTNDIGTNGAEIASEILNTFYDPSYHELILKHGRFLPSQIHVEFHEVLGHGSGKNNPGVNPEAQFGDWFNPMEEGRAEVAAIYHMLDYKNLVDLKILPPHFTYAEAKEFGLNQALQFFTDHITSYHRLQGGHQIRQAHQVGRQIMLNWGLRDKALVVKKSAGGVAQVHIPDAEKLRESMGRLFARFQELKSTGNLSDLKELIQSNWDLNAEQVEWGKAASQALANLNTPDKVLYLNPEFSLALDNHKEIMDVNLIYELPSQGLEVGLNHEFKRLTGKNKSRFNCASQLTTERKN